MITSVYRYDNVSHGPGALETGLVCYGGGQEGTASKAWMYSKQRMATTKFRSPFQSRPQGLARKSKLHARPGRGSILPPLPRGLILPGQRHDLTRYYGLLALGQLGTGLESWEDQRQHIACGNGRAAASPSKPKDAGQDRPLPLQN
jgi:hypothetical protein